MKRTTARNIHLATNAAYWIENPEWHTGNPIADSALRGIRALGLSIHEPMKRLFYDTSKVIAVNGETVVAANGTDKVDKFMFRYPGKMALVDFERHVAREVGVVTQHLAGIALPTMVSIQSANIFRNRRTRLDTVAQTQPRLDLGVNTALDLEVLGGERPSRPLDKTVSDVEDLLIGTRSLIADHGYYPDIADSAGNLRRNTLDGSVTLLDVMPFYSSGNRLIGDRPPGVIPHIQNNIRAYENFVGQYGG